MADAPHLQPRRFSTSQRVALYLADDGRCASCGTELETGWHADHVQPWSLDGSTDVVNGQALCPRCNLAKGATPVSDLRTWQSEFLNDWARRGISDYLLAATPGAGKTRAAFALAERLITGERVDELLVVVPTDALKQQWADFSAVVGLELRPTSNDAGSLPSGYRGRVVTYAQVASQPGLYRAFSSRRRTLVILDEIHHAGDHAMWGEAIRQAFEVAAYRLLLTGTPWRRDGSAIPFVEYGNDSTIVTHYTYAYGRAVSDDVCRAIEFRALDGDIRWVDCGTIVSTSLGRDDLADDNIPQALKGAYDPQASWIPGVLKLANDELNELRESVPDAGGLVIAHDQWLARAYAKHLDRITGETTTIVISDEVDAQRALDEFRSSTRRWLVAVRMVSEGVDIPRLAVGVYAAKARTPLFFHQIVGRFVRSAPGEEHYARLFMPALPALVSLAHEIEVQLSYALTEDSSESPVSKMDMQNPRLDMRESLSASEPELIASIMGGVGISEADLLEARRQCQQHGIAAASARGVASLLRSLAVPVAVPATVKAVEPAHRREKALRTQLTMLVNRTAYRLDQHPKDLNSKLYTEFGMRSAMSCAQLESAIETVARW